MESLESLYDILKKLCRRPSQETSGVSRRGAMRAGLELFAHHAQLFSSLLVTDVSYWYSELRPWCASTNRDDHRVGWRAMSALLAALGAGFEALAEAKTTPPGLTFLLAKLKSLLTAQSGGGSGGSLKDVSLAVQGYGQLARPLYRLLPPTEYLQLCQEVLAYMEQLHLESTADLQRRWSLELASSHLVACARLLAPLLDNSSLRGSSPPVGRAGTSSPPGSRAASPEHLLFSLETLAVSLVRKFARLPPGQYQSMAVAGLRQVLTLSCDDKSTKAVGLLETIVQQAMLETCSHPAVGEEDTTGVENEYTITYRSYLPLWTGLLRGPGGDHRLAGRVYDCFVSQLVAMIDRLDLSVQVVVGADEEEEDGLNGGGVSLNMSFTQSAGGSCDNQTRKFVLQSLKEEELGSKRAAVVKDYTVLVNLVGLAAQVMVTCSAGTWAVDPHSFFANPDSSVLPQCGSGSSFKNFVKNCRYRYLMKRVFCIWNKKELSKVKKSNWSKFT